MKSLLFLVMLAVMFITTPASAQTAAEKAVYAADQAWLKVFAAKDLKKSVDFCTTAGAILAPNSPRATGAKEITALFAGFFQIPALSIEWKPIKTEVSKSGEMAVTTGNYKMGFTGPDGKPATENGKYVTVWKKDKARKWLVSLDIFNADAAAPGQ